ADHRPLHSSPTRRSYDLVGALNNNNVPNFGATQSTQTTAGGAVASSTITAVYVSSLTVVWTASPQTVTGYDIEASTGAWPNSFSGNVSSVTTNTSATTLTFNVGTLIPEIGRSHV